MFVVILFIFLGILSGYLLRKKALAGNDAKMEEVTRWQGRIVTWLIWLLLFLLGIEVGSNDRIISALPTLGVEALGLSSAATLGSCLLARGLWKMVKDNNKDVLPLKENISKETVSKETTLKGGTER